MNNPLVSWLMPVYNCEATVGRAIDSMINQTYPGPVEIIIVDDGSTDKTYEISREYAANDNRIRIVKNENNLGVARSLNKGLDLCNGKFIARMDSDDVSLPSRLDKQIAFMELNPDCGLLGTFCRIIDGDSSYITDLPVTAEECLCRILLSVPFIHPTIMLRTETLRKHNICYPCEAAEDYALGVLISQYSTIANLPEALLDRHISEDQLCSRNHAIIRKSSSEISKRAIKNILGVETGIYSDNYFGWRGTDDAPKDVHGYLHNGLNLLLEIKEANNRLKIYNDTELHYVLSRQWSQTKAEAYFSCIPLGFVNPDKSLDIPLLINAYLAMCESNASVLLYGTGSFCESILANAGSYPFRVVGVCDSNPKKQGTLFFGINVYAPDDISALSYDYILVSSEMYAEEIYLHLLNIINIKQEKILPVLTAGEASFHLFKRNMARARYAATGNKTAFVFCAPDYGNLGDHAIMEAEHRFIADCTQCDVVEVPLSLYYSNLPQLKQQIKNDDIIYVTGGGFLGSLWPYTQAQAASVIEEFSDITAIIFPQTMCWEEGENLDQEKERIRRVYESHKNLTLCARDEVSYQLMLKAYPNCKTMLAPDMALSCDWTDYYDSDIKRSGALLCLKTDKESILTEQDKEQIQAAAKLLFETVTEGNTNYDYPITALTRKKALCTKLNEFRAAKLVLTDRLHGMIFAAVTETPCIVLNNCNHKLSSNFEWVKHIPNIRFADKVDDIPQLSTEAVSAESTRFKIMKERYAKLRNVLKSCIM